MSALPTLRPTILVVDDEPLIRSELRRLLERSGYLVAEAGSVAEATALRPSSFDLVLCDLRLPGEEGTALLPRSGTTPVLIMTSFATVRSAVAAMKQGAVDYIAKPFDSDELLETLARLLRHSTKRSREPRAEPPSKPHAAAHQEPIEPVWGTSGVMREVASSVAKVAPTPATVLILGESGTGKEVVARAIHAQSARASGPFVPVNCAAIPEMLFESELFGHERGAFTGASSAHVGLVQSAERGTLFLDEVGEMSMPSQARMLRWLQESEIRRVGSNRAERVDTRLVAATHRDLPKLIASSHFREDLYFRLRVFQIKVPALRERTQDIVALARALLQRVGARLGRPGLELSSAAGDELRAYHWPGNVRELENTIERAVILSDKQVIGAKALGLGELRREATRVAGGAQGRGEASIDAYVRGFVLDHQQTLTETEIAQRLGLSRKSLWERRRRLGIPRVKPGS